MASELVERWHGLALRGLLGLAFGFIAFLWPTMTLSLLVLGFGVYALLDGFVVIAMGTRRGSERHAWLLVIEGLAGVALGLAVFVWAGTARALVLHAVAVWAVVTGILEVFAFVRLRREGPAEILLGVGATASILLGGALLVLPPDGALLLVILLGSYALVFGASMLVQGLRLRRALRG